MIVDGMRILVGALVVVAGVLKLKEGIAGFSEEVASFRLLPAWGEKLVVAFLPPFEIVVGGFVVSNFPGPWVWLNIAILGGYTFAILSVIVRGIATECGCFGTVMKMQASPVLVVRNCFFVVMLLPSAVQVRWSGLGLTSACVALIAVSTFSAYRMGKILKGGRLQLEVGSSL